MISMRRAIYEDIPSIMNFIDQYWKKDHILARDRSFFEWQFVDGKQVNMFLAIDEDGKIYGIQGGILYSQSDTPDISGSIWKTIKSNNPMLGIELGDFMYQQLRARYTCSPGMSKKATKIYKMMGLVSASLDHYYRLNERKDYKIAKIRNKIIPPAKNTGYRMEPIHSIDEMKEIISEQELAQGIMSKDYAYIQKRYFAHPIYQYDIWKIISLQGSANSVIITRPEEAQGRKSCKIIDFYGRESDLGQIAAALDQFMKEYDYEFVDIYSFGIPADIYEQGGFVRCDVEDENIIPNYFHPFEQKNVSLDMIDPLIPGMKLFRGDGDQDRPS